MSPRPSLQCHRSSFLAISHLSKALMNLPLRHAFPSSSLVNDPAPLLRLTPIPKSSSLHRLSHPRICLVHLPLYRLPPSSSSFFLCDITLHSKSSPTAFNFTLPLWAVMGSPSRASSRQRRGLAGRGR
ncbi:unnamed protein product [Cuscuta campestris]|uniref:Uncharacterized protein n=1 Tax=Cuscuta campestris TaxID=132261 RepID=A0A484L6N1_9ASTE|nr:unnamed protein product [Cuscuta campestris]